MTAAGGEESRPPVSGIVGRRQRPALEWTIRLAMVLAVLGLAVPGRGGRAIATAAVTTVISAPLLRVMWLVWRWYQERDFRFMGVGLGLLGVVALGALLTWFGVGR